MRRWMLFTALFFGLAPGLAALEDAEQAAESVAATVLTLEGPAQLADAQGYSDLALGQLLGPGDRVRTGEGGGLHLALADGSSLALGPNTEITLQALGGGGEGSDTVVELARGLLNALVERHKGRSSFEERTANAVVAVKGTEFEVQAGAQETVVTVNEGVVELGDAARKRFEPVLPLHRRRLSQGRLLAEERLAKRDAGAFRQRWARARVFHSQRQELLKHFKGQDRLQRARWRKALLKRRAAREAAREQRQERRKERREQRQGR